MACGKAQACCILMFTQSDGWPEDHPNYAGYEPKGFDSATAFAAFLTFWSSPKPFDAFVGSSVGARGQAGERTYQTAYRVPWNAVASYQILNGQVAVTGGVFVGDEDEFSPVKEPHAVDHETRPTSGATLYIDAR
jgi:hypothetical protein